MHKRTRWILAGALSLALAIGCRQEEPQERGERGKLTVPATPEVLPEPSPDEKLAQAVREAILQAPALAGESITVTVSRGEVVLSGEVSAAHLRDEAVAISGDVPGVERVRSEIRVRR
jgi:osmotically-inducible protein OsmY